MKFVQTTVHPTVQNDNPDRMVEVGGLVSESPFFTLASVSNDLLKATSLETCSPSAQGMDPKKQIPSIDLETPPRELSLPQDSK